MKTRQICRTRNSPWSIHHGAVPQYYPSKEGLVQLRQKHRRTCRTTAALLPHLKDHDCGKPQAEVTALAIKHALDEAAPTARARSPKPAGRMGLGQIQAQIQAQALPVARAFETSRRREVLSLTHHPRQSCPTGQFGQFLRASRGRRSRGAATSSSAATDRRHQLRLVGKLPTSKCRRPPPRRKDGVRRHRCFGCGRETVALYGGINNTASGIELPHGSAFKPHTRTP